MSELDIKTVLNNHVEKLMSIDGVTGLMIGETENKTPCIIVLVVNKNEKLCQLLPSALDGFPVLIEESGEFKAM